MSYRVPQLSMFCTNTLISYFRSRDQCKLLPPFFLFFFSSKSFYYLACIQLFSRTIFFFLKNCVMQLPTYVYMDTSMCAYSSVNTYTALLSKRRSAKDHFSLDQIYLQQINVTTKIRAYMIIMRHNQPPQ